MEMSLEANCSINYWGNFLNKAHLFTSKHWTLLLIAASPQAREKISRHTSPACTWCLPALQPHLGLPPTSSLHFSSPWFFPVRQSHPTLSTLEPPNCFYTPPCSHPDVFLGLSASSPPGQSPPARPVPSPPAPWPPHPPGHHSLNYMFHVCLSH